MSSEQRIAAAAWIASTSSQTSLRSPPQHESPPHLSPHRSSSRSREREREHAHAASDRITKEAMLAQHLSHRAVSSKITSNRTENGLLRQGRILRGKVSNARGAFKAMTSPQQGCKHGHGSRRDASRHNDTNSSINSVNSDNSTGSIHSNGGTGRNKNNKTPTRRGDSESLGESFFTPESTPARTHKSSYNGPSPLSAAQPLAWHTAKASRQRHDPDDISYPSDLSERRSAALWEKQKERLRKQQAKEQAQMAHDVQEAQFQKLYYEQFPQEVRHTHRKGMQVGIRERHQDRDDDEGKDEEDGEEEEKVIEDDARQAGRGAAYRVMIQGGTPSEAARAAAEVASATARGGGASESESRAAGVAAAAAAAAATYMLQGGGGEGGMESMMMREEEGGGINGAASANARAATEAARAAHQAYENLSPRPLNGSMNSSRSRTPSSRKSSMSHSISYS